VLSTTLHVPSPRRRLVPRARLTDQLRVNGAAGPRLILGAAPAWFGKTTLLARWLEAA
jgi:LuxR family maltose regulon positive regulatory protein